MNGSNKMPKATLTLELPSGYKEWKEKELQEFLRKHQTTVKEKKITVARLTNPADPELEGLGMSITEPQIEVQGKVFNDPIHGHVVLHPLLVKIINTPQFDRLRHLKQLGAAYYVFPGACHNRFEHSIGVAHLAGQFAQALKTNQPELNIIDRDVLCVQVAGLCHDLGHGPFSHLFDGMFIPRARPGEERRHEDHSLTMFDHMVERNNLVALMKQYGLVPEQDIPFIKGMMTGKRLRNDQGEQWPYDRRRQDMSFLYEIVANKTNSIDVDKFDYFARDCHHLGIQNHFDHHRFFLFARVCEVDDGMKHICVRDKEVHNLYEMFYARCGFHRKAYQHRVNKLIETMITDAFLKANGHINIQGSGGQTFTLSTAIDDMEAYTKLTDRVLDEILHSSSDELQEAKEIINRIISRDLYKCVGTIVTENEEMSERVKQQWNEHCGQMGGLTAEDFALVVTSLDYGAGENDPISNVHFYSRADPNNARPIPRDEIRTRVSRLLPQHFSEGSVRVYFKRNDEESLEAAKEHFRRLFRNQDFEVMVENQELIARPRHGNMQ